jgi:PEP-CTERM motif-containing protein
MNENRERLTMRKRLKSAAAFLLFLGVTHASTTSAQTYFEPGDAGDLPGLAAEISFGATAIQGALGTSDRDVYRIYLEGGGSFSARVTFASRDTQLFLFDAARRGVYANDDATSSDLHPLLPSAHALTPTAAGWYYLAISHWNDDPVSNFDPGFCIGSLCFGGDDGDLIFPDFTSVVGATGPGGLSPFNGWTDGSQASGPSTYTIALTGLADVPAIPEPETYALLLAGLALLGFEARRRKKFLGASE